MDSSFFNFKGSFYEFEWMCDQQPDLGDLGAAGEALPIAIATKAPPEKAEKQWQNSFHARSFHT